jgi:hypothetical protein
MPTQKQKDASKKNIKKAQNKWKTMTSRQRAIAQPQGRKRAKPGTKGTGEYFRIVVRSKEQFSSFKVDDVGKKGNIERVAGHRPSGTWDTQAWLISKDMAKKIGNTLETSNKDVKGVLDNLGSKPKYLKGDIFTAKPRPNIPEKDKPTRKQKTARKKNIKRAQKVR